MARKPSSGARETSPDVVVMDINMPRLSGIEATRCIKEDLPHVVVIGLSMHEEDDMGQAIREAGAAAYFRKDTPAEVLLPAILSLFWGVSNAVFSLILWGLPTPFACLWRHFPSTLRVAN